ncbi:MAG: hypothetical protein ACFB2W_26270 [Leptolyngbyaceae cyanobacterium]
MKNRLVLAVVTTAAFTLSNTSASSAQTTSYDFTVDILSGPLLGESYTGLTSIDLTELSENNNETIKSQSISFMFGGVEFTEADDIQDIDANSPRANFLDGDFLGNTYIVSRFGENPTEIPLIQNVLIDGFAIDNDEFGYVIGADLYRGQVSYSVPLEAAVIEEIDGPVQQVPEPSLWLGLATIGYAIHRLNQQQPPPS